jgi:hypothetical protein
MNEQTNSSSVAFMEVTSRKIDCQDKKIVLLEEKLKSIPDNTAIIQKLILKVEGLGEDFKIGRFQEDKFGDFLAKLDAGIKLLRNPLRNKVLHQHRLSKPLWVSAGLFLALSLACTGWYNSSSKLESFISNDTKYRYIRLDTAKKGLQLYLDRVDSLYETNPNMRKMVIEIEQEYQRNFERLQKAQHLKTEALDLEKEVQKK